MKINKRTALAAGSLAAAAIALAGCSNSPSDSGSKGPDSTPVTISMLVNITPNLTQAYWQSLVQPFETANPNITVNIQAPVAAGVKATLPQLLAAGTAPDIVESLPPTPQLEPELLDLSKYSFAKTGPLSEQYKLDGKYFVAGVGQQLQSAVFYNKKAFSDAGITETPKTLEDFEADLAKLKDAGWVALQNGTDFNSAYLAGWIGAATVLSKYPDWYSQMRDGKLSWSDTFGPYADLYAKWVKDGYFPKDVGGIKYADGQTQFLEGKTAMYPMGSWFGAAEATTPDAPEIGVFTTPAAAGTKNPKVGTSLANPYMVLKSSKHADAAVKLVKFLTTDKSSIVSQLRVDGNFRAGFTYPSDALAKAMQALVTATPQKNFIPTGDGFGSAYAPPGYQAEFTLQMQSILIGGSADAAKKAMDEWWDSNR